MSIIIRLQNLPLEANSLDIRRFFQGLHIPDGGVHIVGGENGDAFIAFGTDEDARQAMERNGNLIKGSRIKLLLSSRNEMQRVIDNARTQTLGLMSTGKAPLANPASSAPPQVQNPSQFHNQYQSSPSNLAPTQASNPSSFDMKSQSNMSSYSSVYNAQSMSGISSTYGMQSTPSMSNNKPVSDMYPQSVSQSYKRSRSRSRSPPPTSRIRTEINSKTDPMSNNSASLTSNMQSGLIGSLQQHSYSQNGSSYNNSGNGGIGISSSTVYDNPVSNRDSSYYSRNYPPPHSSSDEQKYSESRWSQSNSSTAAQSNLMANNNQSNMNESYRSSGHVPEDAYNKNQDPLMPSNNHGGQTSYNQIPPSGQYSQSGPSHPNEPTLPIQQPSSRMFTLEVWNLPLNVRVMDLVDFFRPLYLHEDNIKIFYDEKGFPTGIALVRFPSPREFDTALSYNNKYLGERQIQIRPLDDMNGSNPPPNSNQMPNNLPSASGPPIEPYHDNYRQFRDSPGPTDLYNRPPVQTGPFNGPPPTMPSPHPGPNKELVVFMKGLPYSNCTQKDVAHFFEPIELANIEIEMDNRGKPTGNAYVEFKNKQDYDRGMEYNMRHMGRRYIELIPLIDKFGPPGRFGPPRVPGPYGDNSGQRTYCISVRGLSPNVTSQDLKMYFNNVGARPYAVHIMLMANQMNAGEAFLEFVDESSQHRALNRNGCCIGPDILTVRPVPYEVVMGAIQQPPNAGPIGPPPGRQGPPEYYRESKNREKYRGEKERSRGGRHGPTSDSRNGPTPFYDKACILTALNISTKASDDDLCVFFSDYNITPGRIRRRVLEKDNSIEAQISFYSIEDAEHALRNMDKKYFLGRNIHLKFA